MSAFMASIFLCEGHSNEAHAMVAVLQQPEAPNACQ